MSLSKPVKNALLFLGIIGLIFSAAFSYSFIQKNAQKKTPNQTTTVKSRISKAPSAQKKTSSLPRGEAPSADSGRAFSIGPRDAKVVVVEFIDFQCPFCKEAQPILKKIIQRYQGKSVRFVIRHFPIISIHPFALGAAHASLCAGEQGRFLSLHDLFYQQQEHFDETTITTSALNIKLNLVQFNQCQAQKKYQSIIAKDIADAEALEVGGTPTWFVNGEKFEGVISFEIFTEIIDRALK